MKDTIGYGSREARIRVSHVADGDMVLQIRRPVDRKRDKLDWIRIPLGLVPDLESEMRAAVNTAGVPEAANDDLGASAGEPLFDNSVRTELPARNPA